ncbi:MULTISPECIES: glycosyltransferase family 1 protein [Methylobacterium]|uniref:GDP-mannose-dependent alpha-mannosyltransferase n=2 Tax=Pseudomonadota TaxID=1224 RepID=A0ABQ4SY91_9HYPH|nr:MULTISPECIES: glycosyltransferase family 1 protein [Methylobacterium]PIU07349.1 MAG: alpha-mannosyltransferase [Methylobacterium sp. CG09_land_8_20_14_0_10_71_15]PIU11952.1 MAG: alpha-mannosyltransferase [Methylobacterium sp. CG08_land_8_20_14_0_20_71_15]GBU16145.1 GDP-mannose-dependent alpha-mannosyltransferase [Methylobacterium sp.]GJE08171.1 GDP-mannose-dependent alpha-mannosyltransferase [Methylobacterium jeotgali]
MRLLIATDAWHPQVNGVVRSLEHMEAAGRTMGHEPLFLTPRDFRSVPLPGYPEIRLSLAGRRSVERRCDALAPSHVHIATEGPIGHAARRYCLARGRPFTTSYHTRFPEYLAARAPVPQSWSYAWLRRFHGAACGTMVSTPSLERDLAGRGFTNLMRWTRGVDTELFRPQPDDAPDPFAGLPRPIFLFVGRVAVEKNLDAFLALDLPGTKVVVGDGPDRARLEALDPAARFLGTRTGAELARLYAAADVFVFPSLTDTFGIVLLEALACGLPVAAYPVTGPLDVIGGTGAGVLDRDLRAAALAALDISREVCRAEAERYTWAESARQFYTNIETAHARAPLPAAPARPPVAGAAELG